MCAFLRWFLDTVNKPKSVFHEFEMWIRDIASGFASIFQEGDFQIKRFVALVVTIGPTFKPQYIFS